MKKVSVLLVMSLMALMAGAGASYAGEGKKSHLPTPKHAIHELHEAKEVLKKLPADSEGHLAKASQLIDQAEQELSAIKAGPKADS